MNVTILRFDSIGSTNDEAIRQARSGAAEGLCVVAREQTGGRGRHAGRKWFSPPDAGLYFSIVLRPTFERRRWALITLAAAVAVHNALRRTYDLVSDIKWANDIHVGGRKICGILAETVDSDGTSAVVLGIGVNIKAGAVPPELTTVATSVEAEVDCVPDAEILLPELVTNLIENYRILIQANGDEQIIARWTARSTYAAGKSVRVASEGETITGVTVGLNRDGALRLQTADGLIKTFYAGDVTSLRADELGSKNSGETL